jgi:hypothetical protein
MIECSVDACDVETYNWVRKGLDWNNLNEAVERMLRLRAELKSTSKIVCSAVNQKGVDFDAVEDYWVKGKGLDYIIKRKFCMGRQLDSDRSADPTAYL